LSKKEKKRNKKKKKKERKKESVAKVFKKIREVSLLWGAEIREITCAAIATRN